MDRLRMACGNCFDYDKGKSHCTIRYTVLADKSKVPMIRKPTDRGCKVFMYRNLDVD